MKPTHEHSDEKLLQALFEKTAEEPAGPTLTKLKARAADIPGRAARRPWWLSLRIFGPGTAVLAGAAAVLMATSWFDGSHPVPVGSHLAQPEAGSTLASPPQPELAVTEPDDMPEDDLLAGLDPGWDLDENDGDELIAPLDGPSSDDELDDWLSATAALLGEDG